MKITYTVTCKDHGIVVDIAGYDADKQDTINIDVKPCSQCQFESYEKGIESLLSKGWKP